jgi:hypothetical protein
MKRIALTQNQSIIILVIFAALFTLGAALYTYTGPDRTVIETVSACVVKLWTCQKNEDKGDYRYQATEDWVCANENKPWLAYPSSSGPCDSGNVGAQHYSQESVDTQAPVTYPPATVRGLPLCASPGLNGWCAGGGALSITGSEPVAGYQIIAVEGTHNSASFACANAATCSVPLAEGSNSFSYWALSNWGDSSLMGSAALNQDSQAPQVNGSPPARPAITAGISLPLT